MALRPGGLLLSGNVRTELAIVGGGPAGCAAALMARSLEVRCVVIEPGRVGGRLWSIPLMSNVAGLGDAGPAAAALMSKQLDEAGVAVIAAAARKVDLVDEGIVLHLDGRPQTVTATSVIWAAGVRPASAVGHPLITFGGGSFAELHAIGANFDRIAAARTVVFVGADRPLSTFLRSTERCPQVHVLCMPGEEHKLAELVEVPHTVTILPVTGVHVRPGIGDTCSVTATSNGEEVHVAHDALVVTNLGNLPNTAPLLGVVDLDAQGFAVESRSVNVILAGDAAHLTHQRIAVAMGDGARAALSYYYRREGVLLSPVPTVASV